MNKSSCSIKVDDWDIYNDTESYSNVIIDLRNIKDKLNNTETWITIRGSNLCNHNTVDENGICKQCGAYHYPLGAEYNSVDFYKHLYLVAQRLNADTVMFISERFYPDDFRMSLFDTYIVENKYKFVYSKMLISGLGKHWKIKKQKSDRLYLIIFSNKLKDIYDDMIMSKDFDFQIQNIIDNMFGSKVYYDKLEVPSYYSKDINYKGFEKLFYNSMRNRKRKIF